ncbi:putative ubiquitin-protein ligase [Leptomonas pyrrhocoris]|uniref:HECT-type E3 ubiquitin transferase n=1 Tax=Leptomonas pyrrhocoris TaxID=157538 RepID=A0A0N0VG97_LEPPY|nr:putative ubiquitin-protein ligase [Leptomonas pyrrhocoris]KPA83101.1 putative ubiquitin-protein ligase [Leptomonas pyrrhocoris]|eukprot:XP_015661540.1 putative ubiquitin-protein ligase [Leptomonas pyrrhocoris]
MSQFIFNGTSRMRNVTFAQDHHKSRTSIIEDAHRQRLRREEEARRTRAAQRLQRVMRQWLAGLKVMRLALKNIRQLPSDLARLLASATSGAAAAARPASGLEAELTARLHTACWFFSYAVAHPSRIPVHGSTALHTSLDSDEEESVWRETAKLRSPVTFKGLAEVQAHQLQVLQQYGGIVCTALRSCAPGASRGEVLDAPAPLWQHLLSSLSTKDVSILLYVLLQQLPDVVVRHRGETVAPAAGSVQSGGSDTISRNERFFRALIGSVVDAVAARNAAYRAGVNEEEEKEGGSGASTPCFSLIPSSPSYVDRWPAIQALTMALELASQEPALSQEWIRQEYTAALQPLLNAFPAPPSIPLLATANEAAASSFPPTMAESSSAFARVCWRCMCAAFSADEHLLLTTNPLVVLLNAEEAALFDGDAAAGGDGGRASCGSDACCAVLIGECYARIALDTRLTSGEEVNGIRGGPLSARVLGRLVRLLPHVQQLVKSTAPYAADVLKRYLLSVSCLSERLCREPFFIESILADHYAYNTGQKHATLADAATVATTTATTAAQNLPRSQYRLLSSYLFSTEGGLRLMQLLTAEDEAREQLRLQAVEKPTVEAPSDASAPLADAPPTGENEETLSSAETASAAPGVSAATPSSPHTTHSPTPASPVTVTSASIGPAVAWPTSALAQQSPLEILCNVFAWPLFTFSKPDYSRYQQETLALCAKLVRTPQLLRRLWSLYWQSCEGLRAVLPPGPVLQKLCARPVWGAEERASAPAPKQQRGAHGRRVPAAAATEPLLASLPRLPTWETHPRYPMSFYDPHPSLSIFFFTLLAHYVNVCDFADELRRGGDTAVFSVEESCALILALKEVVHRAHLYGVVPDSNGEAVAHAACLLLSRLHIVNEADPFVPAGADGLWMSVGMVAAESAVVSLVPRWDEASAAVVDEEKAAVEEEVAAGEYAAPVATSITASTAAAAAAAGRSRGLGSTGDSAAAGAVVLSRLPGDDLMFHGSRNWDTKVRYIKLLVHTPFLLPFRARALLMSALLASQEDQWTPPSDRPTVVHRGRVFADIYDLFHANPMSSNVYNIRFASEDGTMEAGYGRGVYRECIVTLCKEGFAAEYGLFRQTADGYVFPNSFSAIATGDPQHLQKIRFLGAMVGRALRDGVLQDVPFAQHFRNAILGRRNTLNNLKGFDAELYHQLMSLTQLGEEELQAVGLTFVYTVNLLGVTKDVELVRGGAQMEVTPRNCLYYVHLVADFKLNREAADQTRAFCAGLHSVLDSNRLLLFDSNEVGKLFGGDESGEIDLQDWKENTVYDGAEDAAKPQARLFWDVVESLTRKQQSQLLKFATSMTRPPLLGFRFLSPPFKLQLLSANVSGEDHLPSASTCFSTLKLPPYRDYATARAKIIAAIEETGTFEYS